jgi:hypothetical protein
MFIVTFVSLHKVLLYYCMYSLHKVRAMKFCLIIIIVTIYILCEIRWQLSNNDALVAATGRDDGLLGVEYHLRIEIVNHNAVIYLHNTVAI